MRSKITNNFVIWTYSPINSEMQLKYMPKYHTSYFYSQNIFTEIRCALETVGGC